MPDRPLPILRIVLVTIAIVLIVFAIIFALEDPGAEFAYPI
ncbi:MAG: hypothetical protein ACJA2W_002702 [Planctomycetota bacterium]|jgi:hypothetical protein